MSVSAGDFLVPLSAVGSKDVGLVGGKAASLGEMLTAGINVPDGFAITAAAYREYSQKMIPLELANQINEAFERLGVDRVAIRSSALAEDSVEASWAGQFETFLNVDKKGLMKAVQDCWRSAQSGRAKAYASRQQEQGHDSAVAVVVQQMVDSDASGVMFTVNPLDQNDSEIIIEAGYGLGETIVQGKIVPDSYSVNKSDFKVNRRDIHSKEVQLIFRDGRNVEEPVDESLKKKSAVADGVIVKLAKLAAEVEKHYEQPQDIEWAVSRGQIYLLQSRPITTLSTKKKSARVVTRQEPILSGQGAAPGVTTGGVRVITDLKLLDTAKAGEILVAKLTTPEFTEVFGKMAAVVTDTGGMASHAAIVSRELDIPAVVATGTATTTLKTGDVVTVDGTTGKVYRGKVDFEVDEQPQAQPEQHTLASTGNDIDDLVNSLVSDPMDTREFWPLAPGSLMSYFDIDQALDMRQKIQQLLKEGATVQTIAPLFKRAQLVRYFLVNAGLVGIKLARGLKIAPLSVEDQIEFAGWFTDILKQFQPDDPFNLKGKNAVWSDGQAQEFVEQHEMHTVDPEARRILNLASVQLFVYNWSCYGDYYGPIGLSMHGAYDLPSGGSLLVKEYFRPPTEIWELGKEIPYNHLLIVQQYEGVDLYVNYSNRLLNKLPISSFNTKYHIIKDGKSISPKELSDILEEVKVITKKQTDLVNKLSGLDKVRKWSQLAYYAHKDFYQHFGKQWYQEDAVETNIKEFGDRFLKDKELANPEDRPIEFRKKLWDPRNDYYPGQ